ncbi:MAG: slipin family protein [archaeon]|nr:slipin family protein [archaeon]
MADIIGTLGFIVFAGFWIVVLLVMVVLFFVRIVIQYERGVKFTLGKYSGIMNPGVNIIIPIFQTYRKVDIRIKTIDVPKQEVMTRDNVPVNINAVIYFKVKDPAKAVLDIQDYMFATAQLAQTALRDIVGASNLDTVLTKRDEIGAQIKQLVDIETDAWGIDITNIKMQDVELPQDMKRVMAKQAEAEREKRAVIIKAEGEVIASTNLAKAAKTLSASNGAMHLRTLNTLNDLSSDQSNTVIFAIPLEILKAFEGMSKKK